MRPGLSLPAPQQDSPVPQDPESVVPSGVNPAIKAQFASPLKLTEAQDAKFLSENILRIHELRLENGLTDTNDVIPGSWMWLRQNHEKYYQGDLSWRLAFGGIFLKSNITLGSGLRHVRYNSARVQDDLLGTSPFFAALATKPSKEALAKQVEEYIQGEIERSNVRSSLREAQKIAIYRNECVVKTGYISDTTPYVGEATVLVDATTNEPILTPEKALYVRENDSVIEHPEIQDAVMLEEDPSFWMLEHPDEGFVNVPAYGDPANGGTPEREGRYQYFPALPQVMVHQEGVYADPLDYRSFLSPLRVKSIHDADTVVHLYLETPNRLQKVYGGIDCSQNYFTYWNQPGQDKPKYEQGETDQPSTAIYQQIIVAEVYRRCDPDQTGEDKEVLAVLDLTNGKTIYRNYLANHMGKRPFESIPGVEKVPGRWYGRGIYGMLDSHLFYEDVEASRSFFKNSQDSTIQFGYKSACDSWKNGQPPVVGTGDTIWINDTWDSTGQKKPIWREPLASNFAPDVELMNTMRQSADSLVGSISTASASQSNFDQSKTATGNQLVQQAADVILRATEQDQTESINLILAQVVDVILEHMDTKVLAANPETGLLATINQHEARALARDVRLLLTRSKSSQLLSTSTQALAIIKDYRQFVQTDPEGAKIARPEYINQLKGLEVQDADARCPDVTDDQIAAWQQAQQQGQQQQNKPPNESISIKLGDLIGSERTQALAKFGIQADEQAAQQAQAVAQQAAAQPAPIIQP